MKIIYIKSCQECPYQDREWEREFQRMVYCCLLLVTNRVDCQFLNANIIQEWCPLEEAK